ncbi:MAG: radical SAM protein, partial [Desulfobacteraceae bacterium]|nr:radical SAM protein [Desulfobacteraceae bacterium]
MKCEICEIGCNIEEGEFGGCRMYTNKNGIIEERYPNSYSTLFPISIETLPTLHFYPNHKFLQVSSIGCNFFCKGCISEILAAGTETLSATLKAMPPEKVIKKAIKEDCKGIIFCINDPSVSFFTFMTLAKLAKENDLLVGFSTNGYFTEKALEQLIPYTDFVNIGMKGFSDKPYKSCGVPSSAPVLRNLKRFFEAGVHVEVAAIHMKGFEHEIYQVADFVTSLSKNIPFQVMRFIPFGEADIEHEPTIKESEALCAKLKKQLIYVYLFNSPGTDMLNTHCPDCNEIVITREFFGPMGSRIIAAMPDAVCECGKQPDIDGNLSPNRYDEHGFFGGYRTTRAFEMLHAIMVCIGANDPEKISELWFDLIETDYLKEFHDVVQLPEAYGGIIDRFAEKTGQVENGLLLKKYINERLNLIKSIAGNAERPTVYYAMGYPLFALNAERFETNLVQAAGGTCLNKQITRKGKPGITISKEEFMDLNPDIIFISGFLSCPASDFYEYCIKHDLMVDAVKNNQIYDHFPLWDFGSPR